MQGDFAASGDIQSEQTWIDDELLGCKFKDAIEKLQWYAMRWKIETFHKILKYGCVFRSS